MPDFPSLLKRLWELPVPSEVGFTHLSVHYFSKQRCWRNQTEEVVNFGQLRESGSLGGGHSLFGCHDAERVFRLVPEVQVASFGWWDPNCCLANVVSSTSLGGSCDIVSSSSSSLAFECHLCSLKVASSKTLIALTFFSATSSTFFPPVIMSST